MNDLRTLLHDGTPFSADPASTAQVDSDVFRGRVALRRSRAKRGARAGFATVAAASIAVIATQIGQPGGATTTATPPSVTATEGALQLVSYTGKQPAGFTIDTVPAGWEVQDSKANQLLLAPIGLANTDTNNFGDKIVVGLSNEATGMTSERVKVGGAPGILFTMEDRDANDNPIESKTKTLYVKQPSGKYLDIQIWDTSTWTTKQITDFGAGIQPTGEAVASVG